MRKIAIFIGLVVSLSSCERVAPNYYGVLMENYGKEGKTDYSKQQGRVNTLGAGTELFQVPAFEQRASFTNEDNTDRVKESKKSELINQINKLSDDNYYIIHLTTEGNSLNIFNSALLMPAGNEATTRIVSKDVLSQILLDLLDGKSEHRGY